MTITNENQSIDHLFPNERTTSVRDTSFGNQLISPEQDLQRPKSAPPSPALNTHKFAPYHKDSTSKITEWTKKRFAEFKNYGCTWILEQDIDDINLYTPEDYEELACLQKRVRSALTRNTLMDPSELKLYSSLDRLIEASYEKSELKVSSLHKLFCEAFSGKKLPYLNKCKGVIMINFDQLYFTQELLKIVFPGLFALAQNKKNIQLVSQLATKIVLGDSKALEFSSSYNIFELMDSEQPFTKSTPFLLFDKRDANLCSSIFTNTLSRSPISDICHSSFEVMVKEFIEGHNIISVSNKDLLWPSKNCEKTLFDFLQTLRRQFLDNTNNMETTKQGKLKTNLTNFFSSLTDAASLKLNKQDDKLEQWKSTLKDAFKFIHPNLLKGLYTPIDSEVGITKSLLGQDLVNIALGAKFLEFLIYLKSDHRKQASDGLQGLYSDCLYNKSGNKERVSPEIKTTKVSYAFSPSMQPISCTIENLISISSNTAKSLELSEDFGASVPVGIVTSTAAYEFDDTNDFYLHKNVEVYSNLVNKCQWNWRCPHPILVHTLKRTKPAVYENSVKYRLKKFIKQLEQISTYEKNDELTVTETGKIKITKQQNDLLSVIFNYWGSSSSDEEQDNSQDSSKQIERLSSKLMTLFSAGKSAYEEFIKLQESLSKETHPSNVMLSYKLANLLESAVLGINKYISTQISKGDDNVREEFKPLVQFIFNNISPLLPSPSSHFDTQHTQNGVLFHISNALFESNNYTEIDWKVIRYQSILRQLRQGLTEIITHTFSLYEHSNPMQFFLSQTFEEGAESKFRDIVNNLLFNVDLNARSPENCDQKYLKHVRKAYATNFITAIRECIDLLAAEKDLKSDFHDKIQRCVYQICDFLYTKVDLEKECFALNQKFYDLGNQLIGTDKSAVPSLKTSNYYLTERIEKLHTYFYKVGSNHKAPEISRWAKSFKDHWNLGFDPNTEGNVPHQLGELLITQGTRSKRINFLAFGSTTIEGYINYAQTNGEFSAWMENYRLEGKSHLFVINQDLRTGSFWKRLFGGNETDRINAILGFSKDFDKTLFPIVLSKNSKFFRQTGKFENASDAQEFKKELVNQHFQSDPTVSGNYIPPHVLEKVPNLEELSRIWVEIIHARLFFSREDLTVEERQTFYDLYQDILVQYLVVQLDVDSFNISCRDAIDRAADSNARLWAHLGLAHNMEKLPRFRERYEAYLLSRAIMTRKRQTIGERVDRNTQTVNYYEKYKSRLQTLPNDIFQTVSILPINP